MAAASRPLKLTLKKPRPSSPRRATDQQSRELKLQADKLIGADSSHILALLNNLYTPGEPFESRRGEANKVLGVAVKEYPNAVVLTLTQHLESSANGNTRARCAKLLHSLFCRQRSLCNRLSKFFLVQIKAVLFQRIDLESYSKVVENLIHVVADVARVLLPKKQWPELHDFIFNSLKTHAPKKNIFVLVLLTELIPKCPEVFLFHIDVLSDAFKHFMNRMKVNRSLGAAAVQAAVMLVLHLATPSNHAKYYDLLIYMGMTLIHSVDKSKDAVTQGIIKDMTILAQTETRFLSPHIGFLVKHMLDVAETYLYVDNKTRQLAVEFVVIVAEDVEYGCGMIQGMSPELLQRLFTILLRMLSTIGDEDITLNENDSDGDSDQDELCGGSYSYAMEVIPRLVKALREDVIIRGLPDCFPRLLENIKWKWRHAAITALGLIADGCPKACSGISATFMKIIANLLVDKNLYVRWEAIQSISQISKNWGPHFQGGLYSYFLPALISIMEDSNNPTSQLAAISTILLFSKNCGSEVFSPHLKRIVSSLCKSLQKGESKEQALSALASLADTFQKEFEEYYDAIRGYVKAFLVVRGETKNSMVTAKALECMTSLAVAAGKNRFMADVDKVVHMLINFQESSDDASRYHILQAWGKLAKCLGTDFVPYLTVCMRQVLDYAYLQSYLDPDDESIKSNVVEQKAAACEMLCSFGTEFTTEIHLWIDEILLCLLPLLTFKYDERIKTHAISAMPLMLHSVSCAVKKSLPTYKSIKDLSYQILPALMDALCKERESGIRLKILEALNKCIEITGSCLNKSIINQFIKVIPQILSAYSNTRTERKRRVEKGLDKREYSLLQEEIERENNIYRAIGDCLISIFNIFRTSFLPMFDKLLPCLALWNTNSTEQRIFLHILRCVAVKCGEDACKYYEDRLLSMSKSCDLDDPSVWPLVGYGISICAEFGGNVFRPHCEGALYALQRILRNPMGLEAHNLVNREIAVFALGKMCKFHFHGPETHRGVKIWLSYLPLKNNLVEAHEMHEDLCTMVEKSESKVLGPHPQYNDYKLLIQVFVQILSAGNMTATEDTLNRMKEILRKFKRRMLSRDFESFFSSFPFPVRSAINSYLSF